MTTKRHAAGYAEAIADVMALGRRRHFGWDEYTAVTKFLEAIESGVAKGAAKKGGG